MERRLYKAAVVGDVSSLLQLLHEDELLLDRSLVAGNTMETPLHIAAMLGHFEFAKKLLELKPQLASEVDSQRSTPLHLAASKGYVDIIEILLMVDSETCLATDKYGRNPIQVAAVKGRVEVLERLVNARPDAAKSVSRKGETILHMCVKHNQLEALKVLVGFFGGEEDYEIVNRKDEDGNSVLHLAAMDEQSETMEFLVNNTNIEMNSLNQSGFKAIDLLAHTWRGTRDMEAGSHTQPELELSPTRANRESSKRAKNASKGYNWKKLYKKQNNWVVRMRESLMVVAILTATMAFQAGLNPPAGVWQENSPPNNITTPTDLTLAPSAPPLAAPFTFQTAFGYELPSNTPHFIGFSVMADNCPSLYIVFLVFNTIAFLASLSVILLLISGLPIRNRVYMLVLMVIMWIVITSIALTYAVSISVISPEHQIGFVEPVVRYTFLGWFGLLALLLISHSIRFVIKMMRKCFRAIFRKRRNIPPV